MKLKTKIAAASAALLMGATSSALAAPVSLDLAGVGAPVSSFDWYPGNALAKGALPLSTSVASPTSFDLYYQASLTSFNGSNGRAIPLTGLGSAYEITTVMRFGELGFGQAAFPSNANFFLDPSKPNEVRMYKDTTINSSDLNGTGFADGNLFLSGKVVNVSSSNFTPGGAGLVPLDQFGTNDWPGVNSVQGSGSTNLIIKVDSFDNTVITGSNGVPIDLTYLVFSLNFNTSTKVPFQETDPSKKFFDPITNTLFDPAVGTDNGLSGPDFIFQADGNNSFELAQVPEPSTLALTGLGLLLAGGLIRRRAK